MTALDSYQVLRVRVCMYACMHVFACMCVWVHNCVCYRLNIHWAEMLQKRYYRDTGG